MLPAHWAQLKLFHFLRFAIETLRRIFQACITFQILHFTRQVTIGKRCGEVIHTGCAHVQMVVLRTHL